MKKYIECDMACAEVDKGDLLVGNNADFAKEIIRRTPAADVVPRSEVEHLQEEIEGYEHLKVILNTAVDKLRESLEAEIAEKIFSDIDAFVNANKTGIYSPHGNYLGEGISLGLFTKPLDELKKKYHADAADKNFDDGRY